MKLGTLGLLACCLALAGQAGALSWNVSDEPFSLPVPANMVTTAILATASATTICVDGHTNVNGLRDLLAAIPPKEPPPASVAGWP